MESTYFNSGINKAKLGLHDEAIEDFEKAAWEAVSYTHLTLPTKA